jgi:hypothetical protein
MRTTVEEVTNILEDTELSDLEIEGYISSANIFVTDTLGTKGLSATTLANIEMWITAHMIVVTRERVIKKAEAGGASVEYVGKWGEGLLGSTYGQMAVNLDTSGTLMNIAKLKSSAWSKAVPNFD